MIESAAFAIVAAVFFGTVVLPVIPRLAQPGFALASPIRGQAGTPAGTSRNGRAGGGKAAPLPRDIRIIDTNGLRPLPEIPAVIAGAEQKVESRLARHVGRLIELYPERSLMVIRRWLHEVPA